MDIIRTVNADRRYYLDEDKIYNADSLVDTIRRFNDIKIQMYNHLYDLRYDNTGVFSDMTYSQWCTDTFGINAYYACAIYSAASGALSSQNELNKIYIRSKEEDLKARDTKIGSVKEQLERKQAVKKSLGPLPYHQKMEDALYRLPACNRQWDGTSFRKKDNGHGVL